MSKDSLTICLADGRKLGYAEFGDPAGRPLLYFHGGISSRLDIAFADDYCRQNSIRILAPERPGTGLSDPMKNEVLSLDSWARDVNSFLDQMQIERLPLLAWSLAGPYAFACASKMNERISCLATIGAAGPLTCQKEISQLGLLIDRLLLSSNKFFNSLAFLVLVLSAKLPPYLVKAMILSEMRSKSDYSIIQEWTAQESWSFLHESLKQGPGGVIDDYNAAASPWDFDLRDIRQKVHIFHGDEDQICPRFMAEYLARTLPNASLHSVPKHGHFLLHRNLDLVMSALFELSN